MDFLYHKKTESGATDMREKVFEKDDRLGRKGYGDFLKHLVLISDKYKREEDEEGYVIAVDAPWGTGKTYLLEMFCRDLEKEKEIPYVYYDAWENDFWGNAFEPLAETVFQSDIFLEETENKKDKELKKNLKKLLLTIATGFGTQALSKATKMSNDSSKEAIKQIGDILSDKNTPKEWIFGDYENFRQSVFAFKALVKEKIQHSGKLLIIVDELDRCRPTFALQTLEISKHIMNIEGLVFLFALDVKQLSCMVKTVYGQEIDASGYLLRFFSYYSKMPQPNPIGYLINKQNEKNKTVVNYLATMGEIFDFSLRDIDTLLKSSEILEETLLKRYSSPVAHWLYIFFLTMKYKRPDLFEEILNPDEKRSNSTFSKETRKYLEKIKKVNLSFSKIDSLFLSNHRIKEGGLFATKNNGFRMQGIIERIEEGDEKSTIIVHMKNEGRFSRYFRIYEKDEPNLEGMLFYPDFKKWEEIKEMTFGQYIRSNLEFYDFVAGKAGKAGYK